MWILKCKPERVETNTMKQNHTILLFFVISTFLFFSSCGKKHWGLYPNSSILMGFADTEEIANLYSIDSVIADSLKFQGYTRPMVFYYKNKDKIYLKYTHINIAPLSTDDGFRYLGIGEVPSLSADQNINTLYIEWPEGKNDTLEVKFHRDFEGPNNCDCGYPLDKMTLNDKSFVRKTDLDPDGIYLFTR